jgi:hypothetical protein
MFWNAAFVRLDGCLLFAAFAAGMVLVVFSGKRCSGSVGAYENWVCAVCTSPGISISLRSGLHDQRYRAGSRPPAGRGEPQRPDRCAPWHTT